MFSEAFHEQGLQGQAQNFVLFIFVFRFRTGGNAVRFSNTFFGHFWSLTFLPLKIGPIRCFPNLSMHKGFKDRLTLAQSFCFYLCLFTSKQGEMLPVFKKKHFLGPFDPWNFHSKKLGPSDVFRIFPWTRASRTGSELLFFVLFCVKTGGNAARFSKTCFGPIRSLKVLL